MTLPEILKEFENYPINLENVCKMLTKAYIGGLEEAKGCVPKELELKDWSEVGYTDGYNRASSMTNFNIDSKIKELTENK